MHMYELTKEHASTYRALRLNGLKEEVSSFGSAFEEEVEYPLSTFEERLSNPNDCHIGAFEGDTLIGIIGLFKKNTVKLQHIASIGGLYVHPKFRGNGVSKSMIASAIMRAKELQCEQIHLSVNVKNTVAKSIYTSFGFEIIGMEKEILKLPDNTYVDEYRMALYFDEWVEK